MCWTLGGWLAVSIMGLICKVVYISDIVWEQTNQITWIETWQKWDSQSVVRKSIRIDRKSI